MEKLVGFIGMGTMGSRMATWLLEVGYDVTVFNRSKDKTKLLTNQGATTADTIPELVRKVDYICISVSDDSAIDEVTRQALQAECKGKVFISLSTISPTTAETVAKDISDKQAHFLDAPVSGRPLRWSRPN